MRSYVEQHVTEYGVSRLFDLTSVDPDVKCEVRMSSPSGV